MLITLLNLFKSKTKKNKNTVRVKDHVVRLIRPKKLTIHADKLNDDEYHWFI